MSESDPSTINPTNPEGSEVYRDSKKVIAISGDWAVHTFLDEQGNNQHSVGFLRSPYFTEEDIEASQDSQFGSNSV